QRIALLEKTLQVDPLHTNASRVLEKLRNEPRQAQVSVHKVSRKSSPNKLYPVLGLLSLAALLTVAVVVFFLLRDKADKKVALPTLISAQVPESTLTNTPSPAPTLEPSATASPTSSVTPVPTDEPTPTPTLITAAGALLDTQTTIDSLRSIPTTDPNTRPHPTARPRATQTPTKSSDTLFLGSGTRRDPYRYNPELGFSYGLGDRSLVGISGMIHDADDLIQAMNMFNSVAPSGRE